MIRLAAVLLLSVGCDKIDTGSPVVRASDGATATLVIVACPPNDLRALAVGELIELLTRHDQMVIARDGGTARLTINACPGGVPVPLPPVTARRPASR